MEVFEGPGMPGLITQSSWWWLPCRARTSEDDEQLSSTSITTWLEYVKRVRFLVPPFFPTSPALFVTMEIRDTNITLVT